MIPRRVHRIWLGPYRMPEQYVAHARQWEELGYPVHDWDAIDLGKLPIGHDTRKVLDDIHRRGTNAGGGIAKVGTWVQMADVWAYELVRCVGGIVANCDIEPLAELPTGDLDAFVVAESEHFLSNALMGGEAGHPFWSDVCETLPARFWADRFAPMNQTTGPHHLTARWKAAGDDRPVRLEPVPFFPVHYDQENDGGPRPRDGYYVDHRWGHRHPEHLEG